LPIVLDRFAYPLRSRQPRVTGVRTIFVAEDDAVGVFSGLPANATLTPHGGVNILGIPLRAFDDRGHVFRMEYDALWRPTHAFVQTNAAPEELATRTIYGESLPTPEDDNLRGRVYRQYESAGATTNVSFGRARSDSPISMAATPPISSTSMAMVREQNKLDTTSVPPEVDPSGSSRVPGGMIRFRALGLFAAAAGLALGCHEPSVIGPSSAAPGPLALSAPSVVVASAVVPTTDLERVEDRPIARVATDIGTQAQGCVDSVAELPESSLFDRADPRLHAQTLLVASKSARRLMLFVDGTRRQCLPMGLGFDPQGHKQREGDGRTPEGWYRTSDKPWSAFAGAIAIHYPNRSDAQRARSDGRLSRSQYREVLGSLAHERVPLQQTPMGGEVLIHGGGSEQDWTLGCMALDDHDLARLRGALSEDMRVSLLVLP